MRYAKGLLDIKCLGKERGWSIVFKSTGQVVKGTKEYDSQEAAQAAIEALEEDGDDD